MCSLKIPRDELLQRCTGAFRYYGYHGTTMEILSSAYGLTKASSYHYYLNKEALLHNVLEWTHQQLAETLFSVTYDSLLTPRERLEKLGRKAARLFQGDGIGCLMDVVAVGASYGCNELMAPIRNFLDDQAQAFAQFYHLTFDEAQALERGRQLVADFEGAILLTRIYGGPGYIDGVIRRALGQLAGQPAPAFNLNEAFCRTVGITSPRSGS